MNFKNLKITLILALTIALLTSSVFAYGVVENFKNGAIDWEKRVLKARGMGVPNTGYNPIQAKIMARGAAIADAQRNLLGIIKGVRVNSDTTVKNYVMESDVIRTKVKGLIRGAQILKEGWNSMGAYEVTMGIYLNGQNGVAGIIIPLVKKEKPGKPFVAPQPTSNICPTCGQPMPGSKPSYTPPAQTTYQQPVQQPAYQQPAYQQPVQQPAYTAPAANTNYTGLVIDCRGKGVKPAMSPKIITSDGSEVYGTMNISYDYAIEQGVVGYAKDLNKAKRDPRVGSNPLVVKATGVKGAFKCNAIVTTQDATTIQNTGASYLNQCKVMFVVD